MTHGQTALLEGRARRSDGVLGHALSTSATHSPLPSGKARGSGVLLPPARPPTLRVRGPAQTRTALRDALTASVHLRPGVFILNRAHLDSP